MAKHMEASREKTAAPSLPTAAASWVPIEDIRDIASGAEQTALHYRSADCGSRKLKDWAPSLFHPLYRAG